MELKGKVALITGAARVGRDVAIALAERGCDIILSYRNSRASAEETVERIRILGHKAFLFKADLSNEKAARKLIERIGEKIGSLDILINMASVYKPVAFRDISPKDWSENMNVHLSAVYRLSIEAARLMKKQGAGRIVNFSDWICRSGRPRYRNYLPYYVSKAGVIGLTESLAFELAPEILVNAIAPGPILPPLSMTDKEKEEVVEVTPLKRWGGAKEIAKAVSFLIETDFVTGECLRVDGGRHLN